MTFPTTQLTARVLSPTGSPVVGAVMVAQLTVDDVYKGLVVPKTVRAYSNLEGDISIRLFPNELGINGSLYNIYIQHRSFGSVEYLGIAVPDTARMPFESLIGGIPPDPDPGSIVLGGLTVGGGQMVIGSGSLLIG